MNNRFNLVFLLILASVCCSTAAEGTASTFQGWKGEDIRLSCGIQEEPEAVFWVKESISDDQPRTTKATFVEGNFKGVEERFDIDKNFSLVINDLKVADEGLYYCQVTLNDFENFDNSVFMTVNSMASKHAIKECDDTSQSHQRRCTYQTPSNTPTFNLTCVVSGFKPNISMLWTEESGKKLESLSSQQTTLPDDSYERFEMISVSDLGLHGTEETFTCIAIGDSLMNGASTVEITVRPIPGKRGNLGLIIGLVIGIPVALAILSLLVGKCLQKYHPEYLPRKGCGWNPCCWRPHEPEQLHEEEELMGSPRSSVWLTKEQVQRCQEELKEHYRTSRSKIPFAPLNFLECAEMDEINPNLSITDGRKSTTITYGDLLTNVSKRPLIVGEEGVGKTTLCSKIAWDWCQGRILQDLDMVVLVSISDVTNGKSISDIIKTYLSDSNTATTIQIEKYISVNQNKILLVFDGFDEYNGELCGSEVICILRSEQYMSCKVIVTIRSWRAIEFLEDIAHTIAYTLIGIEGFDRKDLSEYINRYFRTHGAGEMVTLGENLITFMEENDIVWLEMAPYPIYCATFCLMWSELSEARREEMKKSETISQVFEEIISFLKEHYSSEVCGNRQTQNSNEHLKKADMAIQDISWIALNGLLDRKHSFREEQFKECRDAMETCCRVGVLAVERDVDVTCFVVPMVSFSHKLFQEYAAGKYIEHLFANDRAKYNDLKKTLLSRYEEFRYVLYFTSALGNELSLDIIDSLLECSDQDYCVDVAFESHSEEAARAVGERWKEYEVLSYKSEHTKAGIAFMVHCNQVQSLHLNGMEGGQTLSRELAKAICSSCVLHKVTLNDFRFHADFYEILIEEASTCQIQDLTVGLRGSRYFDSTGEALAQWMHTMPRLSRLELECVFFPDNFFSTAAAMAQFCQMQELKLIFRSRFPKEEDLAQWVCTLPNLASLSIEYNEARNNFFLIAKDLAPSCQIRELSMNIGDSLLGRRVVHVAEFVSLLPNLARADLDFFFWSEQLSTAVKSLGAHCELENITVNGQPVTKFVRQ